MLKSFALMSMAGVGLLVTYAVLATDGSAKNSPDPVAVSEVDAPAVAEDLIVHEWGTFTSFSGSDGVQLEFQPLTHNDLPSFVIDPAYQTWGSREQVGSRLSADGDAGALLLHSS